MWDWLFIQVDWWWPLIAFIIMVPVGVWLSSLLPTPGAKRHRVEEEAHRAYMSGGGYPAYNEVYRRHGMIPRGGFK